MKYGSPPNVISKELFKYFKEKLSERLEESLMSVGS